MENINFEDFKLQMENIGVYGLVPVIIEWLNYQNITYDVFEELVKRYSRMSQHHKECLKLPFSNQSF